MSLTEFRKSTAAEIRAKGSFELIADGSFLCIVIVPQGEPVIAQYAKLRAEKLGADTNIWLPKKD